MSHRSPTYSESPPSAHEEDGDTDKDYRRNTTEIEERELRASGRRPRPILTIPLEQDEEEEQRRKLFRLLEQERRRNSLIRRALDPISPLSTFPPGFNTLPQTSQERRGDDSIATGEIADSSGSISASSSSAFRTTRNVSRLRPIKVTTQKDTITVSQAVKHMTEERSNATLLIAESGMLSGILTDKDVTFRVLARGLPPETTPVSEVMTKNPRCVYPEASAMAALHTMVAGQFRHLPVLDPTSGGVVGLLDITKCLFDAITKIEVAYQASSSKFLQAVERLEQELSRDYGGEVTGTLLETMRQKLFLPTLRSVIALDSEVPTVRTHTTCRQAAEIMLSLDLCAVIVTNEVDEIVGIFTSKDLVHRVIYRALNPDITTMLSVMTPNPESVNLDTPILDALHLMHDGKFLHLPVIGDSGEVVAVVDVLQLSYGVINQMGSISYDPESLQNLIRSMLGSEEELLSITTTTPTSSIASGFGGNGGEEEPAGRGNITTTPERRRMLMEPMPGIVPANSYTFKMKDDRGHIHRFNAPVDSLDYLIVEVQRRTRNPAISHVKYIDGDGDEVLIFTDEDLLLAVTSARSIQMTHLWLQVGYLSSDPLVEEERNRERLERERELLSLSPSSLSLSTSSSPTLFSSNSSIQREKYRVLAARLAGEEVETKAPRARNERDEERGEERRESRSHERRKGGHRRFFLSPTTPPSASAIAESSSRQETATSSSPSSSRAEKKRDQDGSRKRKGRRRGTVREDDTSGIVYAAAAMGAVAAGVAAAAALIHSKR